MPRAQEDTRRSRVSRVVIDHCVIAVSDWDRSVASYRDVVGAVIVERGSGYVYRFGDQYLSVHGPESTAMLTARTRSGPETAISVSSGWGRSTTRSFTSRHTGSRSNRTRRGEGPARSPRPTRSSAIRRKPAGVRVVRLNPRSIGADASAGRRRRTPPGAAGTEAEAPAGRSRALKRAVASSADNSRTPRLAGGGVDRVQHQEVRGPAPIPEDPRRGAEPVSPRTGIVQCPDRRG